MIQRYNVKRSSEALKILGFNVREPTGGTVIFCMHTLSKEEIWLPKTNNDILEDVLETIFEPINLRFIFFKSVYINLPNNDAYPSDQN